MAVRGGSLVPLDETNLKELPLRVTPSEVKFLDTVVGKVYCLQFTLHNLGPNNLKIRFREPVKPQVTNPVLPRAGPREGRAPKPPPDRGACFVVGSWAPGSCGDGAGLGFLGVVISVSLCICVLAYLFCFPLLLRAGTQGGEIRSRAFQFLHTGFERRERVSMPVS